MKSSPSTLFYQWFMLALTIVILSCCVLLYNELKIGYPGNNYFPENTLVLALFCLLFSIGCYLLEYQAANKRLFSISLELLLFFATMVMITIATNAVQLTPFPLIDPVIIQFETHFNVSLPSAMAWVNQYPVFIYLLTCAYASLSLQMAIIPLLLMAYMYVHPVAAQLRLRKYYCMMLITTILGFTIYYFFPTAAPATFETSPYFSWEQYATGLKLMQIRHYIQPDTVAGGLIALPSFHSIWALLCLYLIYPVKSAYYLLLINNLFLILACVLLGWHYPTDIIAALAILWLAYSVTQWMYKKTL